MSELEDAKLLLEGVKADNVELQKSVTDLQKANSAGKIAELEEKQAKIETAMTEKDEIIDKLVKSTEAQKSVTKELNAMDSDVQKRKEVSEFCKNLRSLAKGEIQVIETAESKSFLERKDYNSGDDALGGVTVLPFLDSMIDKLVREHTDFPALVSGVNISTDKWERIVMNQSNGAIWEKDMANFSDQTKNNTFNKLNIIVQNLHGIAVFTDDLINDSAYDIVGEVLTSLAEDYAIQIALSGWSGNGVGEMSGILTAADGSGFQDIERIATAASTSVTLEDIYDLIGALKAPYQTGAQFRVNRLGITDLRKLRSDSGAGVGTGDFLWQPSNIVGVPATLAGFPISQAQELAADIQAANAEGVVFGNFAKAYTMVNRMGMTVLRDNLTQYPNIAYKSKKRLSGGVTKGEALKILKTTA
jgi:HK97 family phage major capsid protein